MSGGHFDYKQYTCENIADEIDRLIASNGKPNENGFVHEYPLDIIERFKEAAHTLRQAGEMAQRVDWLVSGDDGEDSFRKRWEKEVRPYYKDVRKI